jgi:hypothetical protein
MNESKAKTKKSLDMHDHYIYIYIYIYIYTHVLFYTLGVEYYSTPSCYTEQNSVLFSTHVSVLFSIFVVLGVVLSDTEHCSVVLSIFSTQF